MFSARILNGGNPVHLPYGWEFVVNRYSDHAIGGPESADIDIVAQPDALWACLNWLGYDIEIFAPDGSMTWWGYIDEATIQLGGISIGMSLSGMYNRIRVAYSTEDAGGAPINGHTAWSQDDTSVNRYGTKELQYSADNISLTQAEALRDRLLEKFAAPAPVMRMNISGVGANLRCKGHWARTAWEYYENRGGIEEYVETSGAEVLSGWVLSSTNMAFDGYSNKIHHYAAGLDLVEAGDVLQVTGSTSNNSTFTVTGGVDDEAQKSYVASTIYFDASDDIHDTAEGFTANLTDNQFVNVSGSTSNNAYYIVKSIKDPGHMTVYPGSITNESAGSSITITQGNSVETSERPVNEVATGTVTLTARGVKVGQAFQVDTAFDLHKAAVQIRKLGSPTDNVTFGIYTNSGGNPGTLLGSATLANADIPTYDGAWSEVTFSTLISLTAATAYWLVVNRAGSNSSTDCYRIAINDDDAREGYRGLTYFASLSDGSTWYNKDADVPFRILGGVETSTQLAEMGTDSSHLDVNDVQVSSGVTTNQYRDGDTTIQDEIVALIEQGTSSGSQLLCSVTAEKVFSVYEKPSESARWLLSNDGTVRNAAGTPVRAGQLVAGTWVDLAEAPRYPGLTPFFAVRSEYDVRSDKLTIEPEGMPSPMDFGIQQG